MRILLYDRGVLTAILEKNQEPDFIVDVVNESHFSTF